MEQFKQSVKSETIDLCEFDYVPSFLNVPFFFYYENKDGGSDFMPLELLRESFFVALKDYPILAGRQVMAGRGHAKIVVDKDNLNLPEYRESHSSVHFSELQASRFGCEILPGGAATASIIAAADASGTIKLASIHVVRLVDNSGVVIFASIVHSVVDGTGFCQFISHWGKVCKWMHGGSVACECPSFPFSYLRSTIFDHMPAERKELDVLTKEVLTTNGFIAKWLSWVSPEFRGSVLKTLSAVASDTGHAFHISDKSLAYLHTIAREYIPNGERVSDNDIITGLLSIVFARTGSKKVSNSKSGGFLASLGAFLLPSSYVSHKEHTTLVVVDSRPRLAGLIDAMYNGNAVVVRRFANPTETLHGPISSQALATMVRIVRGLVDDTDAQCIRQIVDDGGRNPAKFVSLLAHSLTTPTMLVTNLSRIPFYDVDFGGGMPAYVRPLVTTVATLAYITRSRPSTGGYEIHLTMTKQAMARLLQIEFWTSLVAKLY
ncbi:hypothetical protein GGI04_000227 [Coemansia thaxteri]|nr:hypothetical protein GGI04_000227 [Coemansia thaxteri]KAJ2474367.1 hypothetical protein GGI02_000164 [Coemansia sp. RSA 2322]